MITTIVERAILRESVATDTAKTTAKQTSNYLNQTKKAATIKSPTFAAKKSGPKPVAYKPTVLKNPTQQQKTLKMSGIVTRASLMEASFRRPQGFSVPANPLSATSNFQKDLKLAKKKKVMSDKLDPDSMMMKSRSQQPNVRESDPLRPMKAAERLVRMQRAKASYSSLSPEHAGNIMNMHGPGSSYSSAKEILPNAVSKNTKRSMMKRKKLGRVAESEIVVPMMKAKIPMNRPWKSQVTKNREFKEMIAKMRSKRNNPVAKSATANTVAESSSVTRAILQESSPRRGNLREGNSELATFRKAYIQSAAVERAKLLEVSVDLLHRAARKAKDRGEEVRFSRLGGYKFAQEHANLAYDSQAARFVNRANKKSGKAYRDLSHDSVERQNSMLAARMKEHRKIRTGLNKVERKAERIRKIGRALRNVQIGGTIAGLAYAAHKARKGRMEFNRRIGNIRKAGKVAAGVLAATVAAKVAKRVFGKKKEAAVKESSAVTRAILMESGWLAKAASDVHRGILSGMRDSAIKKPAFKKVGAMKPVAKPPKPQLSPADLQFI